MRRDPIGRGSAASAASVPLRTRPRGRRRSDRACWALSPSKASLPILFGSERSVETPFPKICLPSDVLLLRFRYEVGNTVA